MKPRSDTKPKARPERPATRMRSETNSKRQARCETSQSQELNGEHQPPGDRGACETESQTQGSE
jgi:hypothetical protein